MVPCEDYVHFIPFELFPVSMYSLWHMDYALFIVEPFENYVHFIPFELFPVSLYSLWQMDYVLFIVEPFENYLHFMSFELFSHQVFLPGFIPFEPWPPKAM